MTIERGGQVKITTNDTKTMRLQHTNDQMWHLPRYMRAKSVLLRLCLFYKHKKILIKHLPIEIANELKLPFQLGSWR